MSEVYNTIGTDINSKFTFNDFGDLELISDFDNIKQAIRNRLSCTLDDLDLYYEDYGSLLFQLLGMRSSEALEFVKIEVETCIMQDPRVLDCEIEAEYQNDGKLLLSIGLTVGDSEDEEELELNFILDKDNEVLNDGDS